MNSADYLIIGYGRMGRRYDGILNEMGIFPLIYEPSHRSKRIMDVDAERVFWEFPRDFPPPNFIFVCSPTDTHDAYLEQLTEKWPQAKILIEKPAVTNYLNTFLLNNHNIFVSSPVRYLPNFNEILDNVLLADRILIRRTVAELRGEIIFDLAIHDIDLLWSLGFDTSQLKTHHYSKYEVEIGGNLRHTITRNWCNVLIRSQINMLDIPIGASIVGHQLFLLPDPPQSGIPFAHSLHDNGESLKAQTEAFLAGKHPDLMTVYADAFRLLSEARC